MADLLQTYNERKYGTQEKSVLGFLASPFQVAAGIGETALQGATSLAGALPALMYGTYEAVRTGDPYKYPEVFGEVQEALTYEPRTVVGKELEKGINYASEKGVQLANWLGETTTGGRPEAALVSGLVRMGAAGAGAVIPYARAVSRRKGADTLKLLEKERIADNKATIAAAEVGETLKLTEGDRVVYSRRPEEKAIKPVTPEEAPLREQADTFVPAQETALGVLEQKVQESRQSAIAPLEGAVEPPPVQKVLDLPIVDLKDNVGRPRMEDFERVFTDTSDADTVRQVLRMDIDDQAKVEVEAPPPMDFDRYTNPVTTFKVVNEPSYEKLRNDSIIDDETSILPERETPVTAPTVDLLKDRTKLSKVAVSSDVQTISAPRVDLLGKVLTESTRTPEAPTRRGGRVAPILTEEQITEARTREQADTARQEQIAAGRQAGPSRDPFARDLQRRRDATNAAKARLEFETARAEANKPMVLGTQLNSGFDVAKGLWYTIQNAKAKLNDAFLRPEPGVKIHETKDKAARLRWRDWAISPYLVGKAQKSFKRISEFGDKYVVEHNKLVMRWGRELENIDKVLKTATDRHISRSELDRVLLFGDIEGKTFTAAELAEMGASKEVRQAYRSIRFLLNAAHKDINSARELAGLEPIGYLKGYVSHNLKDWHILQGNKVIASVPTFYQAMKAANDAKRGGLRGQLHIVPRGYGRSQSGYSKVADDAIQQFEDDFIGRMKMEEQEASSVPGESVSRRYRNFGNLLHRKGNSVVTSSVDTSIREYLNNSARYIASLRFKVNSYKAFRREFGFNPTTEFPRSSVAHYAKQYINNVTGGQVYLDQLVNDMMSRSQGNFGPWVTKFLGKDVAGTVAKNTADLSNFVYIAANLSSALLNYVSMVYGGAILGHGRLWNVWRKTKFGDQSHKQGILERIGVSKYSPQLENFPGSSLTKTGKLHKALYGAFSAMDYDVKGNIGYTAYLKAKAEGNSHVASLKYAREAVVRSTGEISYSEAPAAVRAAGKLGRPFWQLKRTLHKSIENALAFRGKEAVRFWGPFLVLSGYHGIPFIDDIMNLVSWGTNGEVDPELAMKETLMQWTGDDEEKEGVAKLVQIGATVAQYGAGGLAGVDIGRRIGLGDLVSSLGRPAFGNVVSDFWKPLSNGDWTDSALKLTPRAAINASDYMLARDELFKSPYDRGRLTLTDPTWTEELQKGAGFMPIRERNLLEAGRIEARHKRVRQASETRLIDDYIEAKEENDKDAMAEIQAKATEQKVNNFMKRVQDEIKRKTAGKAEAVRKLAGRRRATEVEAYVR